MSIFLCIHIKKSERISNKCGRKMWELGRPEKRFWRPSFTVYCSIFWFLKQGKCFQSKKLKDKTQDGRCNRSKEYLKHLNILISIFSLFGGIKDDLKNGMVFLCTCFMLFHHSSWFWKENGYYTLYYICFNFAVVIDNHLILLSFFPVLMILGPAGISFYLVPCSLRNPCFFQEAGTV